MDDSKLDHRETSVPTRHREHLAVFDKKMLASLLEGKKTIESRFSKNRSVPFGEVVKGDTIFFKQESGPVVAVGTAARVRYFNSLSSNDVDAIRRFFNGDLRADDSFWEKKHDATYATLIDLTDVRPVGPTKIEKKDRRSWIVLDDGQISDLVSSER